MRARAVLTAKRGLTVLLACLVLGSCGAGSGAPGPESDSGSTRDGSETTITSSRGPTEVYSFFRDSETSLALGVGSCNGNPTVTEFEEADNEVRVAVVATTYSEGPECGDVVNVELDEPLGDRVVVDLTTGQTVREE